MLPRRTRLRRSKDIAAIVRRGRRIMTPWVRIYWQHSQGDVTRSACVVGTRVDSSAVRRHRYQRWLRVLAAETLPFFHSPSDVVWVATPAIKQCQSLAQLRQGVLPHFTSRS